MPSIEWIVDLVNEVNQALVPWRAEIVNFGIK